MSGLFQLRGFVEGCGEGGELFLGEPGCMLAVQRSFPVGFEVISGDLSLIFAVGGAVVSLVMGSCFLPLINKPQ